MTVCTSEARLVRLERQNRILTCSLIALALAAALAAAAGMQEGESSTQPSGVDASEFRLLDKDGRTRAMLAMLDEGPALVMLDAQGDTRARLVLDTNNGPALSMRDHNGCIRIMLGMKPTNASLALADANGADRLTLTTGDADATLTFFDHRHKSRARMALEEDGQTSMHFFTTDSMPLLSVLAGEEGPSMALSGLDGRHLWCMPKGSQPEPAEVITDPPPMEARP